MNNETYVFVWSEGKVGLVTSNFDDLCSFVKSNNIMRGDIQVWKDNKHQSMDNDKYKLIMSIMSNNCSSFIEGKMGCQCTICDRGCRNVADKDECGKGYCTPCVEGEPDDH